jgi:hypothetical protein
VGLPSIKKNADGTWTLVGVQEKYSTQSQADYEELVKASLQLTGNEGQSARYLLQTNPEVSGGVLAALAKNGAVPNNQLTQTLIDIDKFTKAQREKDTFEENRKIQNEKFSRTLHGRIWNFIKGASRTIALGLETPFEALGALARSNRKSLDQFTGNIAKVGINAALPKGISVPQPQAEPGGLDIASQTKDLVLQTKAGQIAKAVLDNKDIDLGQGFFASEETGLGFAARQKKIEAYKVTVKLDNGRTYERPYSFADPITELIPGIEPDTGTGSIISAIGDLAVMIATDPGIAYSKLKATRDAIARSQRISKGLSQSTELASLDAKLKTLADETQEAIKSWESSTGLRKVLNEKKFRDALEAQLRVADEYDRLVANPEGIANFLSGKNGAPMVNALADMDFKQIYSIGKSKGRRGGFTVMQAKELAEATTREDVLGVLAKYINGGEVAADVLETGTRVGNAIRGIANSRIMPGKAVAIANAVKGSGARWVAKTPVVEKVLNSFRDLNNHIVETGRLVHASDKDALVEAIYNYGAATKLDSAVIDDLVTTVVNSDSSATVGYTATAKLFDAIFKANGARLGVDADALREATRLFQNGRTDMASYWAERHAAGAKLDYVMAKGKKITMTGPHLDSEYLNSMVYLPPVDDILNVINFTNRLGGKYLENAKELGEFFTNNVWKRMVLVRPAYVIRNIAEEQIRVLGTGHVSFFNNPLTAIAMWLGRTESANPVRRVLGLFDTYRNTLPGPGFKMANAVDELTFESIAHDAADSYIGFMSDRGISGMDYNDVATTLRMHGYNGVDFGHSRWWEGLASEVRILSNSKIARRVASTMKGREQETVNYFLRGEGKADYLEFAKMRSPEIKEWLLTNEGAMAFLFNGKDDAGRIVSVAARVEEAAGKGGEASYLIKNMIAYGKVDLAGTTLQVPRGVQSAENSIKNAAEVAKGKKQLVDINKEFAKVLESAFNGKGDWTGIRMNVPIQEFSRQVKNKKFIQSATNWFFDVAVKFEKTTTMGPEWRQKYWDAIHDIAGSLDADAITKLRATAKDSLTPLQSWKGEAIGSKHPVWKALERTGEGGNVTADMAHKYASHVATKHVRDLFYDASRKRLLFHQLRLIAPFGQAWENTIESWGRIALNNPMQIYKVSKGLQWLTKPESSALYQLTDAKDFYDPNQGFFFTDPLDGQRKLFVPFVANGINFMSNLVLGKTSNRGPVAFSATPQSLNFAFASGSIIPGVGPGITLPLSYLDSAGVNVFNVVPKPLREALYNIVFPFGEADLRQGAIEGVLPNNWRRMLAPFQGIVDAGYAGSYGPVLNYLASGGNYDLDDPADQAKLLRDTDVFAKWFTFWRGFVGLSSAFPLQQNAITTLDDSNVVLNTALFADFKALESQAGGDKNKAYKDFMDLYGADKIFSIISLSSGGPTNLYTYELIKQDPDVVDLYPDTYGYIYPGGGYSTELYRWLRKQGTKKSLSKEELLNRALQLRYFAAKDTLLARSAAEGWSSDMFDEANRNIRKYFAGANIELKFDFYRDKRIKDQLNKIALDDRFNESEAVQGLRDYLYLREQAVKAAGSESDNLATKGAYAQRQWLAAQAKSIIEQYPEFQNMFYAFFKRELEDK